MPAVRFWISCAVVLALVAPASAGDPVTRVKDVAALEGATSIPLVGYGLVVGLAKTGDRRQTIFSTQTLANMLERFGVQVPAAQVNVENIAAVLVIADLPVYARPGARIDVTASSVGDARSLQGGTLLVTPLKGPNGQTYAVAQGPLSLGGFGGGGGGASVTVNHLTVGRVPSGALVQMGTGATLPDTDRLSMVLREPDFVSASRLSQTINAALGSDVAHVVDPGTVSIAVPEGYRGSVASLMARLEVLPIETDQVARVVINERTGTVVVGGAVRLGSAAVAHGNLSVTIRTQFAASQPAPLSQGQTVIVPNVDVNVREESRRLVALDEGTTLDEVVRALNMLGATPRDVIAIMQALKASGALRAEIVVL
jgi:flagellar P-ring protein FlgI